MSSLDAKYERYRIALEASARRHLEAAEALFTSTSGANNPHQGIAGYLFGIAGECALKQIMRESGVLPLPDNERKDDPYYAHFPDLKTLLRDQCSGRRANELSRYAQDNALMSEWDVRMRYASRKDIKGAWVEKWRKSAHELVNAIDGGR